MNKVEIESFTQLTEQNVKLREENARLRLRQIGPKIAVIKLIRELTGKSLKDAKDVVDAIWR